MFVHGGGLKHNITIPVSLIITKDNQKWIHFLRRTNSFTENALIDIYLPVAPKIQINYVFEAFKIKR